MSDTHLAMPATTSQGRTRNRRALSPSSPPGGFPALLILLNVTNLTAKTFTADLYDLQETTPIPEAIDPAFTVRIWDPNDSVFIELTATPTGTPGTVLFANAANFASAREYIFWAWAQGVRGSNGEWIAPIPFVPRP